MSPTEHSLPGRPGPAGRLERNYVTVSAPNVPHGGNRRVSVTLPRCVLVLAVHTSIPARIRLLAGHDIILEKITSADELLVPLVPCPAGVWIPPAEPRLAIKNLSGADSDVAVTLTYLALER